MKTLASFGAGRTLLAAVGVQPRQYQVLVDLFGTLGERKELLGNLGMDRHAMNLTSLGLLIPGGFVALFAFGGGSLATFNMITLAAELAGVVDVARAWRRRTRFSTRQKLPCWRTGRSPAPLTSLPS